MPVPVTPTREEEEEDDSLQYETAKTPAPQRARLDTLNRQMAELIRAKDSMQRQNQAQASKFERETEDLRAQLSKYKSEGKARDAELARCKAEGDAMREELNLYSVIQQQKAVLALAQEQMQIIELERRLVKAESERLLRDHRISLFQAKEYDLIAEIGEKDSQLEAMEADLGRASSSIGQQRATGSKTKAELENKIDKLEATLRSSREREKEARSELGGWLKDEKSREGSADKERRQLQIDLRNAKSELQRTKDEMADVQEDLNNLRDSSKEREKALKAKLKEAQSSGSKLGVAAAVSVEEEEVRAKQKPRAASPKKKEVAKPREKIRNATPDSDDDVASDAGARKKGQKQIDDGPSKKKSKVPLNDSTGENKATQKKHVSPAPELEEQQPEKKKKRKLGGVVPTFTWDPIMSSGDGVIPAYLSPVVKSSSRAVGTIPRAGFPGTTSMRNFTKLA